jgi:hypothetical protein
MASLKPELSGVKAPIKLLLHGTMKTYKSRKKEFNRISRGFTHECKKSLSLFRVDLRMNARNLSAFFARISEPER